MVKPGIYFLGFSVVQRERFELKAMRVGFRIRRRFSDDLSVLVIGEDSDLSIPNELSSSVLFRIPLAEYEKMGGAEAMLDVVHSSRQAKTSSSLESPRRPTSLLVQFKTFTIRDWIVFVAKGVLGVVAFLISIIFASSIFGAWLGSVLIIALLIGVVYKVASLLMASWSDSSL